MIEFNWADQQLFAMSERALYWPSESTLFVADVHLGKAESFRAESIPIPHGTTASTLSRLDRALFRTSAARLILLGDLWHSKAGRTERIDETFLRWRQSHSELDVVLVEGNHDRRAGRVPEGSRVSEVQEPHILGSFALRHMPETFEDHFVLAGHIHPAVLMDGRAGQSLCLPCFWFGERVGVLPSFGDFTGNCRIRPKRGDRVMVVSQDQVIRVA